MPLFSREFIAVPDEAKQQILYKWPDHNIRKYSQLIVEPDQVAVFINRGEVVGTMGPGKHQVSADELPGLGVLIDAATGGNAYRAELFFVGTREYVAIKFGGRIDDVQDPATKMLVGLRVFGDYALRIEDPTQLILQLTGTVDVANNDAVTAWVSEQLLKSLRATVTKQVVAAGWPVVSLSAYTDEIEQGSMTSANTTLATYGLAIARLGNFDISLLEEDADRLRQYTKDVEYSKLAGGYQQMAQAEMLRGAGAGMAQGGGGANPALLAAGFGIGGQMMQPQQAPQQPVPPPQTPSMVPAAAAQQAACSSCQAPIAAGAKFCPSCGAAQTAACPSCSAAVDPDAKFCSSCGTAIPQAGASPATCASCGTELAPGAKFCASCGTATA
jgi:membrane protease subunit (stomatin/prohibitin family)